MIADKKIEATIKSLFDKIEFSKEPKGLYDPLRYMISIGGKRIRPRLCLLAYSLFKDEFDDEVLQAAAALEVFHSFTLLHDDIMDKSAKRRGVPTVWTKWNENTAILSGDVMSIDSYRRLGSVRREVLPEVLALFSETAATVCEGQQYDMDFESLPEVPMKDYMKMIGCKTAVLLACSAKMGALIGGATAEQADALYAFGYDLGLAFQIEDDYLDTYGDEKVFGKPIGGDILNNKKTWLLTRSFEKCEDKKRIAELMALPTGTKEQDIAKITFVKNIYNHLGIAADAREEIERLHSMALDHVKGIEGYEALEKYADKLTGRAK